MCTNMIHNLGIDRLYTQVKMPYTLARCFIVKHLGQFMGIVLDSRRQTVSRAARQWGQGEPAG